MNRYEEQLAQLKHPDVRPGDVVLVNGKKKLVTEVAGALLNLAVEGGTQGLNQSIQ